MDLENSHQIWLSPLPFLIKRQSTAEFTHGATSSRAILLVPDKPPKTTPFGTLQHIRDSQFLTLRHNRN
jgi:hypothetical protein